MVSKVVIAVLLVSLSLVANGDNNNNNNNNNNHYHCYCTHRDITDDSVYLTNMKNDNYNICGSEVSEGAKCIKITGTSTKNGDVTLHKTTDNMLSFVASNNNNNNIDKYCDKTFNTATDTNFKQFRAYMDTGKTYCCDSDLCNST